MIAAAALVAVQSFASTPEGAALGAVYSNGAPPVVRRVNVFGRYAAVLIERGMMEGAEVSSPILVERFSFGWQPLDLLNFRCRLSSHGLTERTEAALMRDMPAVHDNERCQQAKDAGPADQIEALRKIIPGPLVPYVAVSGDWAMGEWYGAGGGQVLFRRRGEGWQRVVRGGGAISVSIARAVGVPRNSWCILGIVDAKCDER